MKHYKLAILALMICLLQSFVSLAQDLSKFDKGLYVNKKDTLAYRILMPQNFDPTKKYPLVLVLHGSGERGKDNEAQLKFGPKLFLNDTIRQRYPAIVVFPQCPDNSFWSNTEFKRDSVNNKTIFDFKEGGEPTKAMHALLGLIDQLRDKPYVDHDRIYVGGLSMGGMGTFELLRRKPKYFAAAFPICGGDNTVNAKKYARKVPVWIFHGAKDNVVPPDHSIVMVEAIKAAGGTPKFTLYPNDGHNSWDDAFAEPQLVPWLFSNVKK
ncbi:prolyl oligopeptidase family serine peptidase [Mucilaginibacter sp. RS28]|uniref:Prolyl oligopeptidase family serine peptidase n=1 Tax=Mucilaginibacter straminoryzae TaxID=2932774 RepID=A0A9X1X6P1_9SPHI|nr:prolyl oligopeptidase family serine peptidase [Mucilaginibacter straminoryzae]MCJ8212019.1 prolyl oligopeptidase family serine peptidase [Mucilaginibacter straminoryzae]